MFSAALADHQDFHAANLSGCLRTSRMPTSLTRQRGKSAEVIECPEPLAALRCPERGGSIPAHDDQGVWTGCKLPSKVPPRPNQTPLSLPEAVANSLCWRS